MKRSFRGSKRIKKGELFMKSNKISMKFDQICSVIRAEL